MKELQAVIFDLDGVITDTAEYHYLAWKEIAKELDIDIDRQFNEQLKGVSRTESFNRVLAHGDRADDFTDEEKQYYAEKKNDLYKELIKQVTPKDLLPGIERLLKDLQQANIKIGLASASKNAFTVIENLQMGSYFDTIVDATKVKNSKPDPEVFLKAADQLGVPYEACVGVEDAEAGVEAINRADMVAVGIGSENELSEAALILSSTVDLTLELIKEVHAASSRS